MANYKNQVAKDKCCYDLAHALYINLKSFVSYKPREERVLLKEKL